MNLFNDNIKNTSVDDINKQIAKIRKDKQDENYEGLDLNILNLSSDKFNKENDLNSSDLLLQTIDEINNTKRNADVQATARELTCDDKSLLDDIEKHLGKQYTNYNHMVKEI